MTPIKVLFVCTGNICRSPTAEAVFRHLVEAQGFADRVLVDSCGVGGWHVGEPPDRRSQATARTRGIDMSGLTARQVRVEDFHEFDHILAMDRGHYDSLIRMAPANAKAQVHLFNDFTVGFRGQDVPDPYYGGVQGFEHVFDMITEGSEGLLAHVLDGH